jgi:hypothetical protein
MDPSVLEELRAATAKAREDLDNNLKIASLDHVMTNLGCYQDVSDLMRARHIYDRDLSELQSKAYTMFRRSHRECQALHPGRNILVVEVVGKSKRVWRTYG